MRLPKLDAHAILKQVKVVISSTPISPRNPHAACAVNRITVRRGAFREFSGSLLDFWEPFGCFLGPFREPSIAFWKLLGASLRSSKAKNKITLLRVIPTMTFQDLYLDICSIYSANLSDIFSDILSGKYSGILFDRCSGIRSGSLSDIYSD